MSIRKRAVVLGLGLLLLSACGGGGWSGAQDDYLEPLNTHEKELVGTYELDDFTVFETGTATHEPRDFETWCGDLELREDRTGTVAFQFCESAGTATLACDRDVAWSADAGLLTLWCLGTQDEDVLVHWSLVGMGQLRTESVVPTNEPNCGLLLVEDGFETLDWNRVE